MDLEDCARQLRVHLLDLPGERSQRRMAPRLHGQPVPRVLASPPRSAATLVLLFQEEAAEGVHLLLTRRTEEVDHHKGQVCLPGGTLHPGESALAAALREAQEEVGLDPGGVRVQGALTPLDVPVSGFRIHPWVGTLAGPLRWQPDPREVAAVLAFPLVCLWDPESRGTRRENRSSGWLDIPYFRHGEVEVWGATAMILSELADVLRPGAADPV